MGYWLMKSEPGEVSIDDVLAMPEQEVAWFGVRNYQARNFMMHDMVRGDGVLFYHSSCAQPGIVGLAKVSRDAAVDATQFDPDSPYFDPRSSLHKPRWHCVTVRVERKTRLLGLKELRQYPALAAMGILARGNRLSITPVTETEWVFIQHLLE